MIRARSALFIVAFALSSFALPQDAPERKRRLMPDEYGDWERLGRTDISPNGSWTFAVINKVDGDPRLVIKASDGPETWTIETATRAAFSDDSNWLVYTLVMPKKQADKMRAEKKTPHTKMGVHSLESGVAITFDDVQRWQFLKDSNFVLIHRYAGEGSKGGGDFEIFNLGNGQTVPVGNVRSFVAHPDGGLVALHTVSASKNEGVSVFNASSQRMHTVAWSQNHFSNLTWAEDTDTLAFLAGEPNEDKDGDWNVVNLARGFTDDDPQLTMFAPEEVEGFAEGQRISDLAGLQISRDGSSVVFGTQEWKEKEKDKPEPGTVPGVEIWHTNDPIVVPRQTRTAGQDRARSDRWVWHPGGEEPMRFAGPELDRVRISPDHDFAVAFDPTPYASSVQVNGIRYVDVVVIDMATGESRTMLERSIANTSRAGASSISLSPEGRYAAFFDGDDWWIEDLASAERRNVTEQFKARFDRRLDDHTVPLKPSASSPMWFEDDARVVLHNDFDAYSVDPATGEGQRLTDGESDDTRFRLMDVGMNEEGLTVGDPMFFNVFDTKTKGSGFWRLEEDGGAKMLMYQDESMRWAAKSDDTDRVLFSMQRWEVSPATYLTNLVFTAVKQVQTTNPDQEKYRWGKAELVQYEAIGQDLQGILVYPAGYMPGLRYPMVTYIYERMSDGLHRYRTPGNTSAYDVQHFSLAGYFVLMPDITYRDRNPGLGALECIEAAVQAVLDLKVGVHPDRIGLTGHSWGGYETVFLATHSKMFNAYVAGAPLTELLSMYNSFYWNSGNSNQVIFEISQGRMEVPWWEDLDSYIANSPLFHAGNITAPMLVEVGTVDGAVDWHQGQYLYQTLRRMGKNMVMLVYADENHGLARPENRKDYTMRARHFFDVYLKGDEPEGWVTKGVPFIQLGEELKPPVKKDDSGGSG